MQLADIKKAITPLKLVFWGALLCVADVYISSVAHGFGLRFDILNDAVGMIMITVGVFRLGDLEVRRRYASAMTFVKVIALAGVADAVYAHIIWSPPPLIAVPLGILGLLTLAAIVVFCVAMRWLCREAGLERAGRSWRVTLVLFVVIYVIPLGTFLCAGLVTLALGGQWNINIHHPALVILIVAIFFVPPIHLLVSTTKMAREAKNLDGGTGAPLQQEPSPTPQGAEADA